MHLSKKFRTILIILIAILVVGLALGLGLRKTVTLIVDGTLRTLTTYAFRVSDLLFAQAIPVSSSDSISPTQGAWLKHGATVIVVHAIPVQILADGKLTTIITSERLPSRLLDQAGVIVRSGDLLLSNGQPMDAAQAFSDKVQSISLQLVRSVTFSLTENGAKHQLSSTAPTLGEALWADGYTLYANDQLTPTASTPLTAGLSATLTRSRLVTIQTQSGNFVFRTSAGTVGQALQAAQLSLQGLDYSDPAPDEPIPPDGRLRLVRVTEQVLIEQTPLKYETKFQPDPSIELDSQSIIQPGEYGISAERVRVRYEDGVEAARKVEDKWVARQPQERIIGYGTSIVMHTTVVDGVTIQYWRTLTMYATSYHPSEGGDITASGLPLQKGVAAVDISIVPFYTQMYIPGYGQAIAADRGSGVIGRWIDLGYSDSDYVPWHSWVTVYFLWPPPDNIVWVVP